MFKDAISTRSLFAGVSILPLILVQQASAQGNTDDLVGIEEIKVEASKFQNSLSNRLDVPKEQFINTVDELSMSQLKTLGFINLQESLTTLPGITFADFNAATGELDLFIRGFEPSFLINNRPIANIQGSNPDQSFIERYEVLKGPSSIVFGPTTPGGVINQVYRTPTEENFIQGTLTGSTFGTVRAEADGNIGELFGQDWLRGRMTVAYENVKFAQDEAFREVFAIRPIIEADISDDTALQLSAAYKDVNGVNTTRFPLFADGSTPTGFTPKTFIGDPNGNTGTENFYADGEVVHNFLDNLKLTVRGAYSDVDTLADYASGFYSYGSYATGEYAYNGPDYGISLVEGYRYGYAYAFRNAGRGNLAYGDVQLAGFFEAFGNRQDILIGYTFQSTTREDDFGEGGFQRIDVDDPSTYIFTGVDYDAIDIFNTDDQFDTLFAKDTLNSVYAEAYFRPLSWLTVPIGVRFDSVKQVRRVGLTPDGDGRDNSFTIRTGLNAAITDNLNVYYSYAESFIPQLGIQRGGTPLPSETGNNHEIGIKGTIYNSLYLTAAIYRLTRANIETEEPGFFPPGVQTFSVAEGEQVVKGFEINVSGNVTPNWTVNFSYAYADTEITEPIAFRVGPIDQIPDHTLSIYSTYTFDDGVLNGVRLGGGVRHVGERFVRTFENGTFGDNVEADLKTSGYTIFDAIIGYKISEHWDAQINVQNLTDERYFVQVGFDRYGGGWKFGQPLNAQFRITATY